MDNIKSNDYITKIEIDLSSWSDHYPTGCVLYSHGVYVDSEFCDNADEFVEFIERYKDMYRPYLTDVKIIFGSYDLDNESAYQCAKEIWNRTKDMICKGVH